MIEPPCLLKRKARAFTLVELMVSMGVLAILSAVLLSVLTTVQNTWSRNLRGSDAHSEARGAFDRLSRTLAQATLNPYWDYDDANNPTSYLRRSELRFLSGPITLSPGSGTRPGITHSIFFQAPLGLTGDSALGSLEETMVSSGFYIEHGTDAALLPAPLASSLPTRSRFRLMQWVQPAERWDLFRHTSGNPAYAGTDWVTIHLPPSAATAGDVHLLAENVVAMVVLPRSPEAEDPTGTALAPSYTYHSADPNWPTLPQAASDHRLPPLVEVVLVALDEPSAARLEEMAPDPVAFLQLDTLFSTAADREDDLEVLTSLLDDNRLGYRLLRGTVRLKTS